MTERSMAPMLNENINAYADMKKQETSQRERLRNQFIDETGRNPTDAELEALLLSQAE